MLSIVIVNFKNPALLRLCLKSLHRVLTPLFEREIIVIDVASDIKTRNVVSEEFPSVRLIPFEENIGFTRGVNEGIKSSHGDYVLLLNSDLVPLSNAIESMYQYMREDPKIGILGPKLLNFDSTNQDACFRFISPMTIIYRRTFLGKLPFGKKHLDYFFMNDKDKTEPLEADWLFGSPIMINREAINKVGFMDERFFLYLSDVDWPRRFWQNGYKVIFFPRAQMYHYHVRHSKGQYGILDVIFKKESRWHLIDAIKYFLKYPPKLFHVPK